MSICKSHANQDGASHTSTLRNHIALSVLLAQQVCFIRFWASRVPPGGVSERVRSRGSFGTFLGSILGPFLGSIWGSFGAHLGVIWTSFEIIRGPKNGPKKNRFVEPVKKIVSPEPPKSIFLTGSPRGGAGGGDFFNRL